MAKYGDIIAGLTVGNYGHTGPSGLTSRFATNGGDLSVSADASSPSGKALNIRKSATSRVFWSRDDINADPDRSTSTSIALIRVDNLDAGSSASFGGIAARGAGSAGSENLVTAMYGRNGGFGRLRTVTYNNGSGIIIESGTPDWVNGGIYWIKLALSGTGYTANLYAENDLNGTAISTVTGSIAENATNWIGFFAFDSATSIDVLYSAVGTGADLPDPPATANPVLSNATATKTGSSTADLSVSTDTSGTPINLTVTTSATPPVRADIISGAGAAFATSQTVGVIGVQNFSATGLAAETTYYGHFVQGDNSNIITTNAFTTDAAPVTSPETAPGNLNPVAISDSEITTTWDAVTNATGYDLEIDGIATDVGNVLSVTTTGLTASTQYDFRVRAYNAVGDGPWSAVVLETTQAAPNNITLITEIDSGNVSATLSTIVNPSSSTPRLNIFARPDTITGTNGSGWRNLFFALENADGRTPVFALDRANMANRETAPTSTWLPCYTQDPPGTLNPTYVYATSRTLVGDQTGTIEFSFDAPLPAGRVYILTHPMGVQADAPVLANDLLVNYPSVISPTGSADINGVFFTSPSELDENGRQVGLHDMYAFKAEFGGNTTDGGPKRKLLLTAGMHAMGEHTSWVCFLSCLKYILDSPNADAAAIRSNWDLYIYFNLTPNGIFGGHRRHNLRSLTDPNRDLVDQSLAEIAAFATAVQADTAGTVDVCFDWHCFASAGNDFISWGPDTPVARRFIELGEPIFGSPARGGGLFIETEGVLSVWAKNVLGAKYSTAAEVQQRASTSYTNYQLIGQNWAKTLAATDADGMFVKAASTAFTMPQFSVSISADNAEPAVGASVAFAMPQFTTAVSAESTAPSSGATVSFTMPQFVASVAAENTVPVFAADVAFAMPQFTVAATGESFISGNVATVSFVMPQFTVSASADKTVPELTATVSFTMPQFTVSVFSGEFEYFNAPGTTITYIAESTEITYNP